MRSLNQGEKMRYPRLLGLGVVAAVWASALIGAGSASATTLYKITQFPIAPIASGTEITASLNAGSSLLIKDKNTTTNDTCTGSELKGKTEGSGATVTIPISTLTFSGCSHTLDVLKPGKLHIAWSSPTNGTVSWSEAEITLKSTVFGVSAVCKAGTGTVIGTITAAGSSGEHAVLDLDAKMDCGAMGTSPWTGNYTVTNPTGLVVEGGSTETTLYKIKQFQIAPIASGTEINASLNAGSSLLIKDKNTTTNDTCTGSELKGKTEGSGSTVTIPISTLTFSGCSHTLDLLKPGKVHIAWSSPTNGTVSWSEAEITLKSTVFGVSAVCKAGTGTVIGTITAAGSSGEHAVLDLDAKMDCGAMGTSPWTGNYTVTNPTGLVVEGGSTETTLYKIKQFQIAPIASGTEINASLNAGSSLLIKDKNTTTNDTCTGSELKGKTEGSGSTVTIPISTLTFSGCSHTLDLLKPGKVHIAWSSPTNGTVSWSEAEITLKSTVFGVSAVCKAGTGTVIGTITAAGSSGEHAVLDLDAKMDCGAMGTSPWTGNYTVTNPTGLVVEGGSTETTLYKITQFPIAPIASGTEITASLNAGSSLLIKDKNTTTNDTCTGSELKGKTEGSGATVTIPISTLTFSGCSHTLDVLKPGKLHIAWSSPTNGTVSWSEAEITLKSTVFGVSAVCKAGTGTVIGTITAAG